MEFRVLGSFEAWDGDTQIAVGGSKRRAVLALLVLHANEVVGKDRLIDELWGESAPRNAAASLHNHISRLRKVLGPDCLITRAWGYVLRIDPEQVDLHKFERLIGDAEPLPAKERSAKFAEALALWRGPALADLVFEPGLAKEIARLEELRLAVLEARIDADLETGRHAGIIGEVEALIAEHPLRERLRGQLILALYRDGRQAEALEVYRETRRLLADELGLEPSPELRELERAILRQDPSLASTVRSQELLDAAPAQARRRWPRSRLVTAAALLLLAGGGVAAAVVAMRGGASHERKAIPAARTTVTSPPQQASSTSKVQPAAATTSEAKPAGASTKSGQASLTKSHARRPPAAVQLGRSRPKTGSTTRSKPAKRRSVTKEYWLADDFSGPAFDSDLWNLHSFGKGVEVAERNGRLEFSIAPDVVYDESVNAVDQHYGTNCYLTGNFDAHIEFKLLSWPEGDGVLVSFGVYFAPPHEAFWSISRQGSMPGFSERYSFWIAQQGGWTPAADMSGALRFSRENGVLVAYYRHGGRWARLGSAYRVPGPASLVVMLAAHPDQFGHQAASAAFDNFEATATSLDCPPGTPLPPRRPHR
jgi:DNA-binding SARP family transcriptional activator